MTVNEFKRWLAKQGATFEPGKRHQKVYLNGRQTVLSNHPSDELKRALLKLSRSNLD